MDHGFVADGLIGGRREAHVPRVGDHLIIGVLLFHACSPSLWFDTAFYLRSAPPHAYQDVEPTFPVHSGRHGHHANSTTVPPLLTEPSRLGEVGPEHRMR